MEIFFLRNEKKILNPSKKREFEHLNGRYILDYALKNFYNINDEVVVKNKKPVLKNGEMHFSISHTTGLIAVGFSKNEIGLDVEFIKDRDLKKLSRRYKIDFDDRHAFYKFWTKYEAEIKLQGRKKDELTFEFLDDYMVSIASMGNIKPVNIYEIKEGLCLRKSALLH